MIGSLSSEKLVEGRGEVGRWREMAHPVEDEKSELVSSRYDLPAQAPGGRHHRRHHAAAPAVASTRRPQAPPSS